MYRLHKGYLLLSVLLLIIEILIAAYLNDSLIRPYGGDFLVVILLYCLMRSFLNLSVLRTSLIVLLISYLVEITQYFRLADILGVRSRVLRILMGSYFTWNDILSYTLGILFVILLEGMVSRYKQRSPAA
ncbi:MAG: hypothetical protein BGO55_18095 [Sphingobacteriales bacterium 50-39]|nr:DUF2809 domain-containing protein [Sphingobacteriales bacterium]OJW54983.1 MAG: hypothetical protein BGO55_18095 [Sphingobacteriales bacterium 50-39]